MCFLNAANGNVVQWQNTVEPDPEDSGSIPDVPREVKFKSCERRIVSNWTMVKPAVFRDVFRCGADAEVQSA